MGRNESRLTAEQLRAQLVQANRDIRGVRQNLQLLRARRTDLRARLTEARAAERLDAAAQAPDENRDVGGEG
jgi:uncharacterized coiled-coil DUF342 family protein